MKHAFLIIIFLFSFSAQAAIHPDERMTDPGLEQRAQALYHELRCTVCQNQSIAESNADIAADLRLLVREQLKENKTDQEIMSYIHSRYGDFVLMTPPVKPQTWLLWFGPFFILMVGAILSYKMIRGQKS